MQKRILLVEDEEHLHEAIKMNLEMENYIVNSLYKFLGLSISQFFNKAT